MSPPSPTLASLTPRQLDIVRLLAEGYTYKQIAGLLGCSPVSVKKHIHYATYRIGARNGDSRIQLVLWYLRITGKCVA